MNRKVFKFALRSGSREENQVRCSFPVWIKNMVKNEEVRHTSHTASLQCALEPSYSADTTFFPQERCHPEQQLVPLASQTC